MIRNSGLFGSTDLVLGRRVLYLGRMELETLIIPQFDLKKKSMSCPGVRANNLQIVFQIDKPSGIADIAMVLFVKLFLSADEWEFPIETFSGTLRHFDRNLIN